MSGHTYKILGIAWLLAVATSAAAQTVTGAQAIPVNDSDSIPAKGLLAIKCFKEAPPDVLGMLTPNTRLEMIDYYEAGINRESQNSAGGPCKVTDISDYSVSFIGGNGLRYQMFVLDPTAETPTIGLISTYDTPVPDSRLLLYHTNWDPLPSAAPAPKTLNLQPSINDWIRPDSKKRLSEAEDALPFVMASYIFDPATSAISVTNNMKQYYTPSDTPGQLSLLRDTLKYVWNPKSRAFIFAK